MYRLSKSRKASNGSPELFPRAARMKRLVTAITLLAMLPLAEIPGQQLPRSYVEARDFTKWEKEVAAYIEQADPRNGPGIAARRIRGCLRHQPHRRREGPPRIVRQGQAPFRPGGLQAARR